MISIQSFMVFLTIFQELEKLSSEWLNYLDFNDVINAISNICNMLIIPYMLTFGNFG